MSHWNLSVIREAIKKKREYIRSFALKEGGGEFENLIILLLK